MAARIGSTPTRYFIRHFIEMLVAMILGMAVLGLAASTIFALLGHGSLYQHVTLRAVLMPSYMTVGMSLCMLYRGHDWPRIREMTMAMFAPFLCCLVPFWTGVISGAVLLAAGHILMVPAMLGVMLYRRHEYSQDHRVHSSESKSVNHATHAIGI